MSPLAISVIIFVCVLGSAMLGMFLGGVLPPHHIKDDSKDIVKLMIGLLATLSALVLGLLISSAKGSFDKMSDEIARSSADIVVLDRALAHYGPEAAEIRTLLKQNYTKTFELLFSADAAERAKLDTPEALARNEAIQVKVNALQPANDAQRLLHTRALAILGDLSLNRWLIVVQRESSRMLPIVLALVFWLCIIFIAFGLFAPRNITVVCGFLVSALSVAGAFFLILEMESPLDGLIRISDAPVRSALSHLGE